MLYGYCFIIDDYVILIIQYQIISFKIPQLNSCDDVNMPHFVGDYSSVLCVVLLSVAIDITMEQNEAEMGRYFLHSVLDGSSNSLAILGLYAGI